MNCKLSLILAISIGCCLMFGFVADADDSALTGGRYPEMVRIPGGEFLMGSTLPKGQLTAMPQHKVRIKSFWLGKYPVTFDEWDACVRDKGCRWRPNDFGDGRGLHPVSDVSYYDAEQYIAWLSKRTGNRYRLPTESEYEYAERGGSTTDFWWGDYPDRSKANFEAERIAPVDQHPENPFGLFDISGNILEWTADCPHVNYQGAPDDGAAWNYGCSGPSDTTLVRLRGGKYSRPAARSAEHQTISASSRYYGIGFRVARSE